MTPSVTEPPIPLTVVITTVNEPGMVVRNFNDLLDQVNGINGELLVVSKMAAAPPAPPNIRIHQVPDGSIFDCRAAAIPLARGEIIAFTEDHCVHPPDWCKRILENFSSRPELMLLGGAVDNGSTQRIEDRINYWTTFSVYAPGQLIARQPCVAQLIVKASAINGSADTGELEFRRLRELQTQSGAVYMDTQLVVRHVQSHGFWNTFAVHYHNGRASSGLSTRHNGREAKFIPSIWWAFKDLAVHFRQCHAAFRAGGRPFPVRTMHLLMILPAALSHCLGALVGYHQGPGASPHRLV